MNPPITQAESEMFYSFVRNFSLRIEQLITETIWSIGALGALYFGHLGHSPGALWALMSGCWRTWGTHLGPSSGAHRALMCGIWGTWDAHLKNLRHSSWEFTHVFWETHLEKLRHPCVVFGQMGQSVEAFVIRAFGN